MTETVAQLASRVIVAVAEEPAAYETRFAKIETDLAVVKSLLGVVIAGVASLVIKASA